jgi:hypothetical protein
MYKSIVFNSYLIKMGNKYSDNQKVMFNLYSYWQN